MKIKKQFNKTDFQYMEKMEKKYYSEEYITPYEESYNWYQQYAQSVVAVCTDHIIGFMNMFPITDSVFNEIKSGTFNDKFLTVNDINHENNNISALFLSCVVIEEEYRKTNALKLLLTEYISIYKDSNVKYIITDNVTPQGEKFSAKMNFEKICTTDHNSSVYIARFADFVKTVGI